MHKPRRWQFSLRTILLFIAATSLALAAMRFATAAWASAVLTTTVLTLLVSVALAASSRGERRSFWFGFAICGMGYFAVVMTPFPPQIVENLATSNAVTFLSDKFHPRPPEFLPRNPPRDSDWITANNLFIDWNARAEKFHLIGQCIWALILGTLGGTLVRLIAGRGPGKSDDQSLSRS